MPLIAGDARSGTGLAGAMAKAVKADDPNSQIEHSYRFLNALARATVEYVVQNAQVSGTVTGSASGTATGVAPPMGGPVVSQVTSTVTGTFSGTIQ